MFEIGGESSLADAVKKKREKNLNVLRLTSSSPSSSFVFPGPVMDPKTFICATAAELDKWMQLMEDRKYKSTAQPLSPSHCALSYLVSVVTAAGQRTLPHAHPRHLALSLCHSCRATSTGKGRSWRGTCSSLPSGSGRGRPSSTWGSRAASPWCTSSTPRDRWQCDFCKTPDLWCISIFFSLQYFFFKIRFVHCFILFTYCYVIYLEFILC